MKSKIQRFLAMSAFLAVICAGTPANAQTISAQWAQREATFHYSGFTTDYSCDGIRYKIRLLLNTMGARDVKVNGICTGPFGAPEPFHTLKLSFSVPVPAKSGDKSESFPAEWREVSVSALHPLDLEWGDCELVEQLRDQVLPLFDPRDVVNKTACVPHQNSVGQPYLRMSLLMPVKQNKRNG